MKIKLLRRFRTKSINFDEDYGRRLLDFTRQDPAVAESLEGSLELRGCVHAIIAALPGDIELDYQHYLDIASVLLYQRAEGYRQATVGFESTALHYETTAFPDAILGEPDSEAEETTED